MNVLLVTVDCLRQDRCGIYGHHRDTTPTLDALARESYIFENAYATGPVTSESFPGLLAGRLSAQTIPRENIYQKRLPGDAPTIASHLRDAGWATSAVISNPRIGTHVGTDRGFETFRNLRTGENTDSSPESEDTSSLMPSIQVGTKLYQLRERMREFDLIPRRYELPFLAFRYYQNFSGWPSVRGESVVDEFLETVSSLSSPFFAWTHLMDVHGPLHPKTVDEGGMVDMSRLSQFRSHAKRVSNTFDPAVAARYDSTVRYVDEQLRRIVEWLKDEEMWDETVLIVTADHGDALYDRGVYGHPHHYMYDELLKVPFIVKTPNSDGERIEQLFSLGWLHELITEICEIKRMDAPLSTEDGMFLGKDSAEKEVLLADSISHLGHSVVARDSEEKYVVQTEQLDGTTDTSVGPEGGVKVDKDPTERSLTPESSSILEQGVRDVVLDVGEFRDREQSGSEEVTAETRDQLRQLGYAE